MNLWKARLVNQFLVVLLDRPIVAMLGVTTSSPGDRIGPEAGRLGLSHWAGPSVTGSAKVSQRFYGGIIIVILTKGKPVP